MDAYHSMYQNQKEQTLDEKINPYNFKRSKRTLQQKQDARKTTQIVKGDASADIPTGENNPKASSLANTMRGQGAGAKQKLDKTKTKKQQKDTQSKGFGESSADLLAAYYAVYEHHKKDEDGNTIPHDGEDLSEIISPAVQLGARKLASTVAKRGIGTAVKKAAGMAAKPLAGKTGLKAVGMAAKTLSKPGVRQGLKKAAGTAAKVGAIGATGYALGRAAQDKPSGGYSSYGDMNFHYVPDGDTLSEDLFDALKSALIEEGCDEKNVMKIMASVTSDLINEVAEDYMRKENIQEALPLLAIPAAKLAAGLLSKKAIAGAALKLGSKAAAKTVLKKGVAGAAKQGLKSAGKAMVKNPLNTMVAGSMVMPQGGGGAPQPQTTQRAVTSGKRTAGMQRMDLDLFDVVKGQLLDEGLTEEEVLDVMTTLTLDEINEGLMPTTLKGALVRSAAVSGGLLAARQVGKKAKEKVDDALNKARDNSPIGGNTRPGSDKIYFGK